MSESAVLTVCAVLDLAWFIVSVALIPIFPLAIICLGLLPYIIVLAIVCENRSDMEILRTIMEDPDSIYTFQEVVVTTSPKQLTDKMRTVKMWRKAEAEQIRKETTVIARCVVCHKPITEADYERGDVVTHETKDLETRKTMIHSATHRQCYKKTRR